MYAIALTDWATGYSFGVGSYLSAEMLSVYFTALADWPTEHSLEGSYFSTEIK